MGCGSSSASSRVVEPIKQPISKVKQVEQEPTPMKTELLIENVEDYIADWKNVIEYLQSKFYLMNYALSQTRSQLGSLESLKSFIRNSPASNEIETLWIIYVWVTHNITYDMNIYKIKNYKPQGDPFTTGSSVCSGYSNLFKELCDSMGIGCQIVSGYAKGLGFKSSRSFKDTNHAWNVVNIENEWLFVDSTWGAGYGKFDTLESVKRFNPYYFLTPHEAIKYTHFANMVRIEGEKLGLAEFEKLPFIDINFFTLGFKFVTKIQNDLIKTSNPFVVQLSAPQNISLMADLKDAHNRKRENSILIQRNNQSNDYEVNVLAPSDGKFKLTLYGALLGTKEHDSIAELCLQMNSVEGTEKKFCKSFLSNTRVYLYGPRYYQIKVNELIIFKIYVENVDKVAIIDSKNQFFQFDRTPNEPDIWYLEKEFEKKGEVSLGVCKSTLYDIIYVYKVI